MTTTQLLAAYGLLTATCCFVILYVRLASLRSKLEKVDQAARNAYDAGYRAGYEQASTEGKSDGHG